MASSSGIRYTYDMLLDENNRLAEAIENTPASTSRYDDLVRETIKVEKMMKSLMRGFRNRWTLCGVLEYINLDPAIISEDIEYSLQDYLQILADRLRINKRDQYNLLQNKTYRTVTISRLKPLVEDFKKKLTPGEIRRENVR